MSTWPNETRVPTGITYVSSDGTKVYNLSNFLAGHPKPCDLPRPERDVLLALLRFCVEGIEHLDAIERSAS